MKYIEHIVATVLIIASFGVGALFAYVASERQLTSLEGVLLQGFSLSAGLLGSFLFGKLSTRKAAQEMIKPHARSAFRRLISLFKSLSRVAIIIADAQGKGSTQEHEIALKQLEAVVTEQLATADDAMEDWNDVVPEDVQELKQRLSLQKTEDLSNG